ncbi:ubiquitin carboxyl-terminal hydrolase 1 [Tribolium castaneum]|uniref:Ubiquitin carboxyl-terminal hydrolase 3-like Protein n=1 Tax=Tribolium castaneum TaxID=7070 RepID=D6WB38_TRICA|nr:PREDICTED: ubiquitin carboxyl-terminal hydrolase 1 [Tribolium castaneum]EEZ98975.1 Ubiquitin carboxyl-terminal hydrolase 3-like Protein [Tribolium castaneum]|eukprot:XP_968799.1 PREDICTED: ubiquitin carboxyl-terminal hydrolase 1 [Tribolium castaneum]
MTILEDNVIPLRSKLRLPTQNQAPKREGSFLEAPYRKRQELDMLNGYRAPEAGDFPVATLANMGNTCFLNSVLYTLRYAPTFLHNLHHLIGDLALVSSRLSQTKAKTSSLGRNVGAITGPSSRSTSSKDLLALSSSDIIPKSKVQIVTEKLHELYVTMHNLEVKESSDAYQPVALLQAIREANSIFEGNHQQDAHELLVYLLDNIRETCDLLTQQVQQNPDLLTESEIIPSPNSSKIWSVRRSWKITKKKEKNAKEAISEEQVNGASVTDTEDACSVDGGGDNNKKKLGYNFVAEDFEGVTLRRTRCLECESVTERKEPFYDIPVPIPVKDTDFEPDSASEIYRKACVTSEKLCDANKYLCEKCQRYNEASRDVLFEKLPNIMVLQLKRFTTSSAGVQKVNTYLPTPLELECFCESCCNVEEDETPPHRYRLCCVIMHLGASMASGHYIAYVKASDHFEDYVECSRNMPKGSLSASSSEKSLNILKFFKPRTIGSLSENKSILSKSVVNGVRMCKSMDCCGVKINKNVVENVVNSYPRNKEDFCNGGPEDMWLECDDESVKPITSQEFKEELAFKPNSTSTPYLLFYSKITDIPLD